jgi:predicted transcriptional regulator
MFPELKSIAGRRKSLGCTQQRMAREVGISQSMITKIERGVVVPNYEIACKIFDFLDDAAHKGERTVKDVMNKRPIALTRNDSVEKVGKLVKKHSISQFPVTEHGKLVGSVSVSDLMGAEKSERISGFVGEPFPTVGLNTPLDVVKALLHTNRAIIISEKGQMVGIVTPEDLL